MRAAASMTRVRSSSVRQMGTITTSVGARSGGMRSPVSSPCVITSPPIMRVDTPQLVFHAKSSPPSAVWNFSSKARAKFCPRLCDVPAWSARLSCIMASHEYVRSAPANFSAALLRPVITGMAMWVSMKSR
jgi:hypothetical protein